MASTIVNEIKSAQLNQRKTKRQPCSIKATISFDGIFLSDCVIKDISTTGMRLFAPKINWLPLEFQITAPPFEKPLTVTKSWGHGEHLGVSFCFDK